MADLSDLLAPTVLWIKLVASITLASTLSSVDYRYAVASRAEPAIGLASQAITATALAPIHLFEWAEERYRAAERLVDENRRLRHRLLELRQKLLSLHALQEENLHLRTLAELDSSPHMGRTLAAEVVSVDTAAFRQQITINRGERDGVYIGQPVLDAHGIVGQVSRIGLLQSVVLLVTDAAHAVLVRNERTGDRYLAHGNGHGLKLRFVPKHNDIRAGDALLTSSLDDTYPTGRLIGRIAQITAPPGRDFLEAYIEAGAKLHRNRIVLLSWKASEDDAADRAPDGDAP